MHPGSKIASILVDELPVLVSCSFCFQPEPTKAGTSDLLHHDLEVKGITSVNKPAGAEPWKGPAHLRDCSRSTGSDTLIKTSAPVKGSQLLEMRRLLSESSVALNFLETPSLMRTKHWQLDCRKMGQEKTLLNS